jgi:hypothetical protein
MVESLLDDLLPRGDLKSDFISTKNDESRPNVNNERADSKSDLISTSNDEIRPKQRASVNQESSAKTKTKLEEKREMKSEQNGINEKEVKIPLILKLSGYYGFKLN